MQNYKNNGYVLVPLSIFFLVQNIEKKMLVPNIDQWKIK